MSLVARASIWLPTLLAVAIAMDAWAGVVHRYAWHRFLWRVHRSHHVPRTGRYEANDVLAGLHAPPAIAAILYGCVAQPGVGRELWFGVGLGMTAFAVAYFIVHDGLVHARLPVKGLLRIRYLRRVAGAHRRHHQDGLDGAPFSLFFGPAELHATADLRRRDRSRASGRPSNPTG